MATTLTWQQHHHSFCQSGIMTNCITCKNDQYKTKACMVCFGDGESPNMSWKIQPTIIQPESIELHLDNSIIPLSSKSTQEMTKNWMEFLLVGILLMTEFSWDCHCKAASSMKIPMQELLNLFDSGYGSTNPGSMSTDYTWKDGHWVVMILP